MKTLLKFGSETCAPCKVIQPLLDRLTSVRVRNIDVTKEVKLAAEYRVRTLPMLILLDEEGGILRTHIGSIKKLELDKFVGD